MANKTRARPRRRAGRGALMLVGGLLIASAALRLGTGPAAAVALEAAASKTEGESTSGPDRDDLARLLAALKDRQAELDARERRLADRAHELSLAEGRLTDKLARLTEAEEALRQTIALADTAAETDLTQLTSVYENMKPKEAAALFEEMEPAFAAGFLGRMRPDMAADILAGLTPEKAYSISVILAGRNADVPKD